MARHPLVALLVALGGVAVRDPRDRSRPGSRPRSRCSRWSDSGSTCCSATPACCRSDTAFSSASPRTPPRSRRFTGSRTSLLAPLASAVVLTTLLGLVVGFLVLRRRGVYFSLLTLAFTALAFSIAFRWTEFTGGESGLRGVTRLALAGIDLDNQFAFYCVVAGDRVRGRVARLARRALAVRHGAGRHPRERAARGLRRLPGPALQARRVRHLGRRHRGRRGACSPSSSSSSRPIRAREFLRRDRRDDDHRRCAAFPRPGAGRAFYILFREALFGYTDAWLFWFGLLFMAFILYSPAGLVGLGERLAAPLRRQREARRR